MVSFTILFVSLTLMCHLQYCLFHSLYGVIYTIVCFTHFKVSFTLLFVSLTLRCHLQYCLFHSLYGVIYNIVCFTHFMVSFTLLFVSHSHYRVGYNSLFPNKLKVWVQLVKFTLTCGCKLHCKIFVINLSKEKRLIIQK